MCVKAPHLLDDWDDCTEVGNISFGSMTKRRWKCNIHGSYMQAVCKRVNGSGCHGCIDRNIRTVEIGAATERAVAELLLLIPGIIDVEITGQEGNPAEDIIVTLANGSRRCVQVKTLVHDHGERYNANGVTGYDPNMLIIAVDKTPSRFFCALASEINVKAGVGLVFSDRAYTYPDNKFKTLTSFLSKVETYLPLTLEVADDAQRFSSNFSKEVASRKRFSLFALEYGLEYKSYEHNASPIDGWVNGHAVQFKFTDQRIWYKYRSNMMTYKEGRMSPYALTDGIEFFIFEIGDYEGNFLIVPIDELYERDYIAGSMIMGKRSIVIPPPGYTPPHSYIPQCWMVPFWNRVDLLQ
jgi:hypothetical protein